MMIRLRAAKPEDLHTIHALTKTIGFGITSIPQDKRTLLQHLEHTTHSFYKEVNTPHQEYYLFVLEDLQHNTIAGISAITACTGFNAPFYSYHMMQKTQICPSLHIRNDYNMLILSNDHQGKSEIGGLYLHPEYHHSAYGQLLSRARFLFIAAFPHRFTPTVIAEMRGVSDSNGRSPFWEHVGRHFFHMTFPEADRLSLLSNKQFIHDLMPHMPLYIPLLAPSAQAVIGKTHHDTIPAMNILLGEGFHNTPYIDIFDAGPTLEATCSTIKSVAQSVLAIISSIHNTVLGQSCIIARQDTPSDFVACLASVLLQANKTVIIDKKTADRLQLSPGQTIRVIPLTQGSSL